MLRKRKQLEQKVSEEDASVLVGENELDLELPGAVDENENEKLGKEIECDETLVHQRLLVNGGKMGYVWDGKSLFHECEDTVVGLKRRLVVPVGRRKHLIYLAHDRTEHIGTHKTRELQNSRFTWPGLVRDVCDYVKLCELCIKLNKSGNANSEMCECPTLSEPFESVAVDIVGPLPKV